MRIGKLENAFYRNYLKTHLNCKVARVRHQRLQRDPDGLWDRNSREEALEICGQPLHSRWQLQSVIEDFNSNNFYF